MARVLDMTPWEHRPWDSEFFGIRIAQITGERATDDQLSATVAQASQASIDCLYFLADASDVETIRAAEGNGFELMDVRLTLERSTVTGAAEPERAPAADGVVIRQARQEDLPVLKSLARISHRNTRFSIDTRFAAGRADDLYALWIERSVSGELSDAVHVVDVEGRARGYLTLSAGGAGATIGLVAVDPAHQGRGYGDWLLRSGLRWAMEKGLDRISVVTQGRNAASVRFYERAGFTTMLVQFWYHRWF
jgi:ribosomal protein S18 acetylase RimI-like enzyme